MYILININLMNLKKNVKKNIIENYNIIILYKKNDIFFSFINTFINYL